MDSEAAAQGPSGGSADSLPTAPSTSSQGKAGPTTKTVSQKRKPNASAASAKAKKRKKAVCDRRFRPHYTVHEGEDMLLLISNTNPYDNLNWRPKKKGSRKKKVTVGNGKASGIKKKKTVPAKPKQANNPLTEKVADTTRHHPELGTDHRWGHTLPEEVLVNIFQMVVFQDGAVPFLCRMARVCRLWNAAASSPVLWHRVSVGFCWIEPRKNQMPKTEMKIKDTFNWLAHNRFSQLRDFSLFHWKKNVDYAVEVVSQSCPHLRSLKLSYCTGATKRAFQSLAANSPSLQSINVQYSEFQVDALVAFLESSGSQIRELLFTHGTKNDRLLAALSRGCCPDLELLEISTNLGSGICNLPIPIRGLQSGCPKLKTFRMLNVIPIPKMVRNGPDSTSGFPLLEELSMASTSYSVMMDKDLGDILFGSTKLRVLDLRGCDQITAFGLADLPCAELECLFWSQYFSSKGAIQKAGLNMLIEKWSGTLRELDIANHNFAEEDLEMAISKLALATNPADSLRYLNLSGSRITPSAVRLVIGRSTALSYLNLSSCRCLPRGLKRVYHGQEDIRQLLDKLEL